MNSNNDKVNTRAGRGVLYGLALLLGAGMTTNASAVVLDYLWTGSQAIPDNGATSVDIVVPDFGTIEDLDVDVVIPHTWQGDLIIELENVDSGITAPLIYRPGDSASNGFGFSADDLGTSLNPFVFDDEAAAFYDSAAPNGIGAIADPGIAQVGGSWIPYGGPQVDALLQHTLAAFDGLDINGTWRLHVADVQGGDEGSIAQFSLHATVTQQVPEPASAALIGLGLSGMFAAARRRARGRRDDAC